MAKFVSAKNLDFPGPPPSLRHSVCKNILSCLGLGKPVKKSSFHNFRSLTSIGFLGGRKLDPSFWFQRRMEAPRPNLFLKDPVTGSKQVQNGTDPMLMRNAKVLHRVTRCTSEPNPPRCRDTAVIMPAAGTYIWQVSTTSRPTLCTAGRSSWKVSRAQTARSWDKR